ncbi:peptidoglycan endopeptidase [Flavobacterium sp. N2820]|uniref:peptidoglycan endopeptidase n=1 Tax=Flavobacterium sp. N2820 TaxID=2986834 RepID=UPI0022246B0E|nr:peptidoglycan endopeptidase [Flavobacterium sp. N2820]
MRFLIIFTVIFLCFTSAVFSQKTIKHTVVEGESFYSIAKKYKVTESDIYKLNPKAKGTLLQLKTVLLIPNKNYKAENKKKKNRPKNDQPSQIHLVESGESLYKIAKKYGISLEKIKELNPNIKPESIQIGDKIIVKASEIEVEIANEESQIVVIQTDSKNSANPEECEDELGNKIHTVQKGETLFKIAKKYKIKLSDLKELNEEVVENLPVGYQLIIKLGTAELDKIQPKTEIISEVKPLSLDNMSKAEFLIAKASEHIGTRYRGGGTTSAGFDCSGLMFATYKQIDMTLPRSSGSMAVGAGVKVDRNQAQKGDLIFFTTNGRGYINHVGMITEVLEDEIKFIHSSVQAGVIISSTKEPYYSKRFVQINRVLTE